MYTYIFSSRSQTIATGDPSTEILSVVDPSPYPSSTRRHTESVVSIPTFQRNGKNSQFIRKPNVKSSRSTKKRPKRNGSTGSNHSESGQSQEGMDMQEEEVSDKVRVQEGQGTGDRL